MFAKIFTQLKKERRVMFMTCPVCGGDTRIIDSRNKDDHKKRRRVCQECGYKFNTIEIDMDLYLKIAYTEPWEVAK